MIQIKTKTTIYFHINNAILIKSLPQKRIFVTEKDSYKSKDYFPLVCVHPTNLVVKKKFLGSDHFRFTLGSLSDHFRNTLLFDRG